jgi:hypothetical protein
VCRQQHQGEGGTRKKQAEELHDPQFIIGTLKSSTMTGCGFGSEKSWISLLKQNFRSSRISLKNMDECHLNAYI